MSEIVSVANLRVADEGFLVSSMIERCPKTMMIRELVTNAIEAASLAAGPKRVTIAPRMISDTPKLCIWNTGPGLSALELNRICDLASTLHKLSGLDANFGMGAKVASLPSNKHGLRYRSCKQGVVSEVILCQRGGVYGRLHRATNSPGRFDEVIDVTDLCHADASYDLSYDWTEVVLFGNSATQNTVLDPYAGNPRSPSNWLFQNLFQRFFRVPRDVAIELDPIFGEFGAGNRFASLSEELNAAGRCETVRTASGILIHYLYMAPTPDSKAAKENVIGSLGGVGGLVYKDEIYDVRSGPAWTLDAPSFGIPFGANSCAVFVELPEDYLVRPEAYRQFLRFRGGDQRQLFLRDFSQLVRVSLPEWLSKLLRSLGPGQSKFIDEIEDEMRDLLAELGVEAQFSSAPPPAIASLSQAARTPLPAAPTKAPAEAKTLAAAKEPQMRFERPAEIISLDNDELIAERGLNNRAAKYYSTSHQLFINLRYPAVTAAAEYLAREFVEARDAERMRMAANSAAGWLVTRKIARALAFSLAKKKLAWPVEDVFRAQSPESFSLTADDWALGIEAARARMEQDLGPNWRVDGARELVEPIS